MEKTNGGHKRQGWIDEKLIIDDWTDHPATEDQASVNLTSGNHGIKLEFYENQGKAVIKLLLSSSKFPKSVILPDYFYHEAEGHRNSGLIGQYYNDPSFKDLKITRVDSTIDFDWDEGSPLIEDPDYVIVNSYYEWYQNEVFDWPNFREAYVVKAAGAPLVRVYQRIKDSP